MQKFHLGPETFGERDRDMLKGERETARVQSQPGRASTVLRGHP